VPDPAENLLPRGDTYGQNTARQAFTEAANAGMPAYQLQPPAPMPPPPQARQVQPRKPMPVNNATLPDGTTLDLNEVLFAPTERPNEPVTAGLGGQPSNAPVSSILQRGIDAGFSTPGMREMLMRARAYGL